MRVATVLERHGRSVAAILGRGGDDADEAADTLQEQQLALASCYGAAARGTTLLTGLFDPSTSLDFGQRS